MSGGSGAILDMGGHTATAVSVLLGWNDGQPISVQNRGTLLTTNLYVGNQTFDLIATDTVSNFYLSNSSTVFGATNIVNYLELSNSSVATTAATGNVTANAIVYSGSTLTLGANLSLTGGLDVRGSGAILDMGGHTATAVTVLLGWNDGQPISVQNRGTLLTTNLYVGNQTFDLIATDSISNLYLSSAMLTTAATGNVTANAIVYSGSTLTLGANLSLTGGLDVRGSGAILDMGGHTATAVTVLLGWNDGQPISVQNRGTLLTTNLYVGNQTFDLIATDTVSNFYLSNSSTVFGATNIVNYLELSNSSVATTAATGNVTGSAGVYSGSTLKLGANLSLTGGLDVRGSGAILDMGGHTATAVTVLLGWNDGQPISVQNRGTAAYEQPLCRQPNVQSDRDRLGAEPVSRQCDGDDRGDGKCHG